MAKKESLKKYERLDAEALMQILFRRMEIEKSAESLNDNVITPFTKALEEVCTARSYILNIFGEKSNIVVTGSEKDAEAIYKLVEDYFAGKS